MTGVGKSEFPVEFVQPFTVINDCNGKVVKGADMYTKMFYGVMIKRIMIILLLITVTFTLCACNPDDSQKSNGKKPLVPDNPYKERYTVHWLTGSEKSHDYEGNRWDELLLEELFNVDIRIWKVPPTVDGEIQFQQYLDAGDLPDIGFYGSLVSRNREYSKEKLYEAGFSKPVPTESLRMHLPSLYKAYENNPQYYSYCKINDKELYSLPIIAVNNMYPRLIGVFNFNWLKNIGFDFEHLHECNFPSTSDYDGYRGRLFFASNKLSIDQFTDILRKFTYDDPDQNGVDDTYGMYMKDEFDSICKPLFGLPHGYSYQYTYDKDSGQCVPFFVSDSVKDMLNWQINGVTDGYLIIKGINSLNKPNAESGRYGCFDVQFATLFTNIQITSVLPSTFNPSTSTTIPSVYGPSLPDGNTKYVVMPVPGEKGGFSAYDYSLYTKGNEYIFANMEQAKMDRIFSMLEYAFFGNERLSFLFGIENIHFRWSGEPYASVPIFNDPRTLDAPYTAYTYMGQSGNIYFRTDPLYLFNYESSISTFYKYFFTYYTYNELFITPYKYIDIDEVVTDVFNGDFDKLISLTQPYFGMVRRIFQNQFTDIDKEYENYKNSLYMNRDFKKLLEFVNDDRFVRYNGVLKIED